MTTFTLLGMLFAAVMLLTATLGLCALGPPPRASAAPQAPGSHAGIVELACTQHPCRNYR
jgi:hypothetical protein